VTTRVYSKRFGMMPPPDGIYVGRPSDWGNPYTVARVGVRTSSTHTFDTLTECLASYEAWLIAQPDLIKRARRELRGKNLVCWCTVDLTGRAPIICHAQILARIADGKKPPIFP
jgi:Domain of unknown function (DUF4326)